ncbi:MAG: actin family protein [Pseudomonadota bacterium]
MCAMNQAVVIDSGSGVTRAGLAGDAEPQAVFAEAVAGSIVGDDADHRSDLDVSHPTAGDGVADWDAMEQLWRHALIDRLAVDPTERAVLLATPPLQSRQDRERAILLMFDTFEVPACYLAVDAMTALLGTGRTTGVVAHIGAYATHVTPVAGGYPVPHATLRLDFGDRHLVDHLAELLAKRGIGVRTPEERAAVTHLLHEHGSVAEDMAEAMADARTSHTVELTDGMTAEIGSERFRAAEPLFHPEQIEVADGGLPATTVRAIGNCPTAVHPTLYGNVVLAGPLAALPGLRERMQKEIETHAPQGTEVVVEVPAAAPHLTWTGAAKLAAMPQFEAMFITRDEYVEHGPGIVHEKCM